MKITFKEEIRSTDKLTNDEIVKLLVKSRHIKNLGEFLSPPSPLNFSLKDFGPYEKSFKKILKILKEIKETNRMIVVYTDYDADGITGGAILWETLYLLGFKVMPYVPHRRLEGYGFSKKGIDNVKKQFDPALIISVDHGITKFKEIKYATTLGIKIIVTDHHLEGKVLPKKAEAIFHISALSGSGVAYFFAKEIFKQFKSKTFNFSLLTFNFNVDYLALASIGTIADLVPLTGPSRSVVKYGLEAFKKIKRVGLKQIIKESGIENKDIATYDVGFIIAPRINAIGRLEHAIDALRLLCTNDEKRARILAHKIGGLNIERQKLVQKSVEEARKKISNLQFPIPKIIILTSDHWHEGIIGLIASKIAEEFYRPALILTKSDENYKGSARSIPSFHITEFLRSLKKNIIDVGGHKQAAGFTLEKKQLDGFTKNAYKLAEKLIKDKDLERKIEADLKVPLTKINLSLVKSLEALEPYGVGNPKPVFYSQGELVDAKLFGKTNDHLKIFVKDKNSLSLELIAFNQADKFQKLSRGNLINIVYTLEIDRWGERERLRGRILNFQ
jgi:single-stranded-DNA-specific exonuclease